MDLRAQGIIPTMARLVVVLLSFAALGGLTGCGGSDTFNPDVVAQAADKTAAVGGAKLAFTIDVGGQHLMGTGFVDVKNRKGRMSFTLPQSRGRMDMVFVNRVFYMHFPAALSKQ